MVKLRKLVLIEPFCFIPIDSGGKNRIYYTVKELSKRYELLVVCFYDDTDNRELTRTYLESRNIKCIFLKKNNRKNILSYLANRIPYWFSEWAGIRIPSNIFSGVDKVIVEFTQLMWVRNFVPKNIPVDFIAHDVSTITFWRRLWQSSNFLKFAINYFRFFEVYLFEKRYFKLFDRVVAVSKHDKDKISNIFNVKDCIVVENGIDQIRFIKRQLPGEILKIGYIGSSSHPPNRVAIDYLVNKIGRCLKQRGINFQIILVGHNETIKDSNLEIIDHVDDLIEFYKKIGLLVAPIFSGSGTRIKIIESLSYGVSVLTTEVGAEGIGIQSSSLRIVRQGEVLKAESWVREILACYSQNFDQGLKNELKKYLWSSLFEKIDF